MIMRLPLSDIRVIDLTVARAGLFLTGAATFGAGSLAAGLAPGIAIATLRASSNFLAGLVHQLGRIRARTAVACGAGPKPGLISDRAC